MDYLSIICEGNSMVWATGHFCYSLAKEIGGHQGRGESVVGGPIAKLAVAIVAPSKHLSIYTAAGKLSFMLSQWLMFYKQIRRSGPHIIYSLGSALLLLDITGYGLFKCQLWKTAAYKERIAKRK